MKNSFNPPAHLPPNTIFNKILYKLRLLFDFQFLSIYSTLNKILPKFSGIVADVGCGSSPFKHLLSKDVNYIGFDVKLSDSFGYKNKDIRYFDGNHIPMENDTVDHIICTEVLEHHPDPKQLISELYRILRTGGSLILTVPWSARIHFQPYDYYRYSPTTLKLFFEKFDVYRLETRGSDISVVANKLIVMASTNFLLIFSKKISFLRLFLIPLHIINFIFIMLLLAVFIPAAHLSLIFQFGNFDDPLGYTLIAIK